jgi:hypothetical protein
MELPYVVSLHQDVVLPSPETNVFAEYQFLKLHYVLTDISMRFKHTERGLVHVRKPKLGEYSSKRTGKLRP